MLLINSCCYSVIFSVLISYSQQLDVPSSPCPNIFHYETNGSEWYGILQAKSSFKDSALILKLQFSIATALHSTNCVEIELLDDHEDALNNIRNYLPVRYKIHFTLFNMIPKITKINFNDQIICTGPPAKGEFVSTITVQHNLTSVAYNFNDELNSNEQEKNKASTLLDNKSYTMDDTPDIDIRMGATDNGFQYGRTKNTIPLIRGGVDTRPGDWPWLIALYTVHQRNINFICGGSLISDRHIITAAHCIHESDRQINRKDLIIKIGVHNLHDWLDANFKYTNVLDVKLYPASEKNSILQNDIAVLVIEPVTFSGYIIPVMLWNGNDDVAGETGTVVGWGRDENGLLATPVPRKVNMTIVTSETCRVLGSDAFDKKLCAKAKGTNGEGPCNGDSGGGLYLWRDERWTLRGIVSHRLNNPFSYQSCDKNEYIVFADSAKYTSWIKQIVDM